MKMASIEAHSFAWQSKTSNQSNLANRFISEPNETNNQINSFDLDSKQVAHKFLASKPNTTLYNQCNKTNQDSKRALIKNQLHLIEQLQLENANLRNERDQLQLENEELKFQLQIISSSNILAQPNTALTSERQLEKYVGAVNAKSSSTSSNEDFHSGNMQSPDPLTTSSNSQKHQHQQHHRTYIGSGCCDSETQLDATYPKITNTPLRNPVKPLNCIGEKSQAGILETSCFSHASTAAVSSAQTICKSAKRTNAPSSFYSAYFTGLINPTLNSHQAGSNATVKAPTSNSNNKSLNAKSSSLSSFDVKQNLGNLIMPAILCGRPVAGDFGADDEDQRVRLVEQRYGGDSDRLQAAALTIQRAFRKYQICKRFRMITEQLRHTCQQSSNQISSSASPTTATTTSTSTTLESTIAKATTAPKTGVCADNHLQHQSIETNSSRLDREAEVVVVASRDTTQRRNQRQQQQQHQNNTIIVSGATRAAAWESLSYAASRLAASAANSLSNNSSITNPRKIIKSSSNTNVAESVTANQKIPNNHMSSSKTNDTQATLLTPLVRAQNQQQEQQQDKQDRRSPLKSSNPVVAAAINFQQLESIRKRQYRVGLNIFNKHPEKGISFLVAHSFIASTSPCTKSTQSYYLSNQIHFIDGKQNLAQQDSTTIQQTCQSCCEEDNLKWNVAHFLLSRKGLAKEKIGQYLGNLQSKFNQDVLKFYLQELDFQGLQIDVALRKFSATLRLPGEAQKIERMVDCFAQRYLQCQQQRPLSRSADVQLNNNSLNACNNQNTTTNQPSQTMGNLFRLGQQKLQQQNLSNYKNNLTLLTRDEIFILTFAIIMLNTDLHSPSLKTTSRMSATQFVNNLRGVFKSQNINESDLLEIYERVKADEITTTPDHLTHVMKVQQSLTIPSNQKKELPNLCVPHRRLVCSCRLFEVYDINKKERVGQHQREVFLFNDMLLITKLARRARANSTQQFAFRQSISLKGLRVQLFQSTYYNYGIRLCHRSKDEAIIMFNAHNELDQSRFVEDLSESIAETDEMDLIRSQNIIETIHLKHLERLKRHAMLHTDDKGSIRVLEDNADLVDEGLGGCNLKRQTITSHEQDHVTTTKQIEFTGQEQRFQMKCSSMSNLSTLAENKDESLLASDKSHHANGIESTPDAPRAMKDSSSGSSTSNNSNGLARRSSASSIHSLDSGMFISRDVSPNQSS